MAMDQLPKTLFKEGTETQVEKVNNTCRTSILKKVEKYVEAEYKEVLGDPLFSQVMDIYVHKLQYSGRVIHSFVCKQLLTAKRHELWFHFARRALRFSMQEFHAITGLKYKDDEPDLDIDKWRGDKGFWSKLLRKKGKISLQQIRKVHLKSCNTWSHVDRLRMVYLCVIAGLVMAKDEKVCIPHKYIKLVMDFDKMRKYPWGLHSFDALVTSITEARDKVKTQNSYVIDGFSYALQIWLMEAIPDIGSLLGTKLKEGVTSMRCRNWKGSAKVSYEDIISIESDFASTGVVFPYISSTGNGNIIVDAGFERDDEMNDERVDLIIDMYRKKYDWSKHVWGYQETEQPYAESSEDDGSKEEEAGERSDCEMEEEIETAHVSPAKKRKNQYRDIGAESRKKRLLCQRSTAMTSSSTSSTCFPRISTHGVPTRCWCGEGITAFGSSTAENRYRRFYRCEIARDRKTENHLFKWIDEALIEEIRMVDVEHERVAQVITKFEERVMEKVKSEMVRVERQMSEKLKEKVDLEIARVAHEMKHKLKIATVAMVVVGAIVGIWTSLRV